MTGEKIQKKTEKKATEYIKNIWNIILGGLAAKQRKNFLFNDTYLWTYFAD